MGFRTLKLLINQVDLRVEVLFHAAARSSSRCQMRRRCGNKTPPHPPPPPPLHPRCSGASLICAQRALRIKRRSFACCGGSAGRLMESSLEFSSSLGSVSSLLLTRCRTFKVLVIGDSGVGKTCLTHRLCAGEFPRGVEATIGVDFRDRALEVEGEKIKVRGEVIVFVFLSCFSGNLG